MTTPPSDSKAPRPGLWYPHLPEAMEDPHTMFRQMREADPLYQAKTGEYILTRYEDIRHVLQSPYARTDFRKSWVNQKATAGVNDGNLTSLQRVTQSTLPFLADAEHIGLKRLLSDIWEFPGVESWCTAEAERLVASLPSDGFDAVGVLTTPLPLHTMLHVLGISPPDVVQLTQWSQNLTKVLDLYISLKDIARMADAATGVEAMFKAALTSEATNQDGLLMTLKRASEHSPVKFDVISLATFLLMAANETTSSVLSHALHRMCHEPELWDIEPANDDEWERYLNEWIRLASPVQFVVRLTSDAITVPGGTIPKGASVNNGLAAGNRDPETFPSPDAFDMYRPQAKNLAFGHGVHYCMGERLTKIELKAAFTALRKFNRFELLGQPTWVKNFTVRGFATLPVRAINY